MQKNFSSIDFVAKMNCLYIQDLFYEIFERSRESKPRIFTFFRLRVNSRILILTGARVLTTKISNWNDFRTIFLLFAGVMTQLIFIRMSSTLAFWKDD